MRIPHFGLTQALSTVEPVDWSDFSSHSRIDSTGDSALVTLYLRAARQLVENDSHRALVNRTVTCQLDRFPAGRDVLWLPKPPLVSVASITYVDTAGASTTMASTDYVVDTRSMPGRVQPRYGSVWPSAQQRLGAVTLTYTAGYGAASTDVPETDRQAIRMLVGHWYEHREAVGDVPKEMEFAYTTLVRSGDLGDMW